MKTSPLRTQRTPPHDPPAAPPSARLLLSLPHRMFFACAMIVLLVAAIGWPWSMLARAGALAGPPPGIGSPIWHVLAMLFAFFAFFMFGFLFTAGPRWLNVDAPPAWQWRPAGLVAFAGALVMLLAPGELPARGGAGVFGLAWLALLATFVRLLLTSRVPDRVHATIVALALLAGASGPLAYAALGSAAYRWLAFAGLWLFAVPVFVTVCHRMIPFFTANVLPTVAIFRPWWLLALLLAGPVAHGVLATIGAQAWTWLVDIPLAALAFDLARRWGLIQSFTNRLLAMLHVGFVWYAIAFALFGLSSLALLVDAGSLGLTGTHALGLGFCGSLMVAMVSRVTFGHSGRTLAADRPTWSLFLLLQAAVIARVVAALWPSPALLALAALLWAGAIVPWALRNLPIYWRPRADGKPG